MKRALAVLIPLTALVTSYFIGFVVGKRCSFIPLIRDGYEEDQASAAFESLVQAWKNFVKDNDGWIPADPYRGLIESGKIDSYASFYGIKFVRPLPPRVNPELWKNPKRVVLTWVRYDIDEVWTCYADGTWAKRSFSQSSTDDYDWHSAIADAGYPLWKSLKERDKWVEDHRSSIVWDDTKRLYVPVSPPIPAPATRAP